MKAFLLSLALLVVMSAPVFAQAGIYDEDLTASDASNSASVSATPKPTPYATPRTTTLLSTADTPVSGAVENTLALLAGGAICLLIGFRFSRE